MLKSQHFVILILMLNSRFSFNISQSPQPLFHVQGDVIFTFYSKYCFPKGTNYSHGGVRNGGFLKCWIPKSPWVSIHSHCHPWLGWFLGTPWFRKPPLNTYFKKFPSVSFSSKKCCCAMGGPVHSRCPRPTPRACEASQMPWSDRLKPARRAKRRMEPGPRKGEEWENEEWVNNGLITPGAPCME